MNRVLITGATGFIGRQCINILKTKNFEIHAISSKKVYPSNNENITWYQVNLTSKEEVHRVFERIRPEYLIHLAWGLVDHGYNSNVQYQWVKTGIDLIDAFSNYGGKRAVMVGTCAEYDWSQGFCSEGNTPLKPHNVYGLCKHTSRIITNSYCKQNKISFVWARIFFAYGPGQNNISLIPTVINNIKNEKEIEILHSDQIRDYIFVEDVAEALVTLVESRLEGSVNISSGSPISIKEIVLKIANYFDKEYLIKFVSKPSQFDYVVGDNSRLLKEMKWKSKISLDEGLRRTIESLT